MSGDKRVNETLTTFLERIDRFKDQYTDKEIVFSDEIQGEHLLDGEDRSIEKEPILWPLLDKKMFYIVRVPAGTTVPKHSHSESIFRLLISGSLEINGKIVSEPGTWFVVREGVGYEIHTTTGYVTIAGYGEACKTRADLSDGAHVIKA